MFKNKLKNYFVNEILKTYLFVLIILSLLIWVIQAAKFLYLITENGVSIRIYSYYVILLFPKIISQLMLPGLFISFFISIIKIQNNKEIEIFWLTGTSKKDLANLIIYCSILIMIICFFFYTFLVPLSNQNSRKVISNSDFTIINSMIKKGNFNSPFKDVTIFVNKNDNNGNLENIYIFEKTKTIIAKYGRVLNLDNKNYLELSNGEVQEKNSKDFLSIIKFSNTIYDFTNLKTNLIKDLKVQERETSWLILEYIKNKNTNYLYELHKRIFKPLFIPMIAIICCFILYSNNEKINSNKIKFIIFLTNTLLVIFVEILLNLSVINNYFRYLLYCSPFFGILFFYLFFNQFIKNEARS